MQSIAVVDKVDWEGSRLETRLTAGPTTGTKQVTGARMVLTVAGAPLSHAVVCSHPGVDQGNQKKP
jgi:methyl coenzyme M reductase subunit D